MSNPTAETKLSRKEFIGWLHGLRPDTLFDGGSCTHCALAIFSGQEVVISTYGPEGDEYKLPRWALRFNDWANERGREKTPFTPLQALQAIKRGYK